MAKAEITVHVTDLPTVKALLTEDGELREEIAEAIATAGEGYWARADAVLKRIRRALGAEEAS